jgi:hypothetical protein
MLFFKKVLETLLSGISNLIIVSRKIGVQCINYQEKILSGN